MKKRQMENLLFHKRKIKVEHVYYLARAAFTDTLSNHVKA